MGVKMRTKLHNFLIFLGFILAAGSAQAQIHKTDQIEVELVSETSNVVPGE
ncbi:MAG: hypothetical protein ACI9IQ_001898, partial [Cyclobacteriaceae bacterium]